MNPGTLPVVEAFHSLQGEGLHTGQSAFFIRLAGCRVGCSWCDTKDSWPVAGHAQWSLSRLAEAALAARQAGAGFVVITGGEPLHHDLTALCALLRSHGLRLHLETSGVDPLRGQVDWIVLSPKRHRPPQDDLLRLCNELKVVVHSHDDLDFAQAMAREAHAAGNHPALLLQPGWDSADGQRLALDFVRSHPDWRLSLQSHKWLAIR